MQDTIVEAAGKRYLINTVSLGQKYRFSLKTAVQRRVNVFYFQRVAASF